MSWVATAVAGVGLVTSYIGARDAKNRGDRVQASQDSAAAADLAFRQEQYDKWVNDYEKPLLEPLREKAQSEGPMNLGPAWANVQSNFDASGRNLEAAYARSGMTGSGLNQSGFASLEAGRASALGDAFQKGLNNRDNLRLTLANLGKQMPQQATNLKQGYSNEVSRYGNRVNQAGAQEDSDWWAVGSNLGTLGKIWGSYSGAPASPSVVSTPGSSTATQARILEANANAAYPQPAPVAPKGASAWDAPSYMRAPAAAPKTAGFSGVWDYAPNTSGI